MKKVLCLLALAAMLFVPWATQAQNELTVYDGTATSNKAPAYIYYFDAYSRSQTVIPSDDLTEMIGGTISSMTFYTNSSNVPYTTTCSADVYLTEVDYTSISSFIATADATIVYQGTLTIESVDGGGQLTIEFETPYTYNGGNLLIGIENTAKGNYKSITFLGQSVTGASVYGNNSSSLSSCTATAANFIPKTTFTYTPGGGGPICYKPGAITVEVLTATEASIGWTPGGDETSWNIYLNDELVASDVTDLNYTFTDLNPNTQYTLGVTAVCDEESQKRTVSVRTACAGMSLPYTCGFEADELQGTSNSEALPWCAYRYASGTGSYTYYPYSYNSTSYAYNGSRSLYYYGSTNSSYPDTMVFILPAVDVNTYPMNGNRLSFWAKMSSASYSKMAYIGTMSDPEDINTFTLADTILVSGTTHTKYIANLPNANPADAHVAIMVLKGSGTMYVDDVTLEVMPSCVEISNLTASNITSNSVTLTWDDEFNVGAGYTIWDHNGLEPVTFGTTEPGVKTATLTNLPPNTWYTFAVAANCSADDNSGEVGISSLRTLNNACEITGVIITGDAYRGDAVVDSVEQSVTVPVRYIADLTTLSGNINSTGYQILIYDTQRGWRQYYGMQTIGQYAAYNEPLTVRVQAEDTSIYKDWAITLVPEECYTPYTLTLEAKRTTVTATWSAADPAARNFEVFILNEPVDSAGLNPEYIATTQVSDTNTYTFTGLNRETTYYVYVRTTCGEDGNSDWQMASVTTKALASCDDPENVITVADGTTTNNFLPIYGGYIDDPIGSQSIYPAEMLTDLVGKTISGLHYFVSSGTGSSWTDTKPMTIKMMVVDDATLSAFLNVDDATTVYDGVLVGSSVNTTNGFNIEFTNNFTYTGGNLLIALQANPEDVGGYSAVGFYGVEATNASRNGYGSTNYNFTASGTARNFLPKVAFQYCVQSDPCPAVAEVVVSDITESGASVSWTASTGDYVGGYELLLSEDTVISYTQIGDDSVATTIVNGDIITVENGLSYTFDNLDAYTEYYVFVRAVCNADGRDEGMSAWQQASFRTLSACGAVSNMVAEITGKTTATVSWEKTKPNQANNFNYILSTTANLTDEELNGMTPTGTGLDSQSVVLTGLENATTYYIYVQNVCGSDDFSPWVSTSFTTYDAMPAVAYIFVADITHSAISVEWERNMELFANETAWQVACVPDSTEVTDWTVVNTPSHTFIGLNANTPYTIHVRPYNTETSVYGPDATIEVVTNDMPAACEIVADGTTTHSKVPLDFYNTDGSSEMHAQMLYPSNLLTRLVGSPIESITFYHQSNVTKALSFSQWTIKMGVTTATDLSNGFDETTLTTVYTGNLEVTGGEFSFVFEDPFEYSGGNLIIDISLPSGSKSGNYFGSSNQGCYGVDGIGSTYSSMSSPNYTSFLPKVQFCYERTGDCWDLANVTVSDVTANSAHVSWIPGNVETEWQYALVSAETSLQDIVENPEILTTVSNQTSIDLTNLNADFDYYLYIRPVCGDTNYGNFTERKFQTLPTCGIPTVLPATNIGTTYATLHVMADSTVGTPMNYTFRVWPAGTEDYIMVTSTTDSVEIADLQPNTDYYYEAQTTCTDNNGSSRWSNQEMFHTDISCFPVSNLQVTEVTSNSVTLTWAAVEGISTYGLTIDSVYMTDASDTTITIEDLEPNTLYNFGVSVYCGQYNSEEVIVSARTACAPMPYPWQESFEASINSDPCWAGNSAMAAADVFNGDTLQLNAANAWQFTNSVSNGIEADHYKVNIYGTSCKKWLITPEIDLTEAPTAMLYFDAAFTTYSGNNPATNFDTNNSQAFMVLVSTDGGLTWPEAYATKWQNVGGQHTLAEIAGTEYVQQTVDLTQFVGGTIRIAFYAQSLASGGDNNLHIDNLTVTEAPAVFPVSNLTVDSVTANSVTLSWSNDPRNPDSTTFIVSDNFNTWQFDTTTATINGLTSNTTYTFYVMAQIPTGEISIDKSIEVTTGASCFPVSDLYFDEVTTESVTLSWLDTINNGATYTVDISMLINDSLETVATYNSQLTTITINGLTPWTAYYFNVYANCTANDRSDAVQTTTTTSCDVDPCIVSIVGHDSYGDGWQNAFIRVEQNSITLGSFTLASGSEMTTDYNVCGSLPVNFTWTKGTYDGECSFEIQNANGTVYSVSNAGNLTDGETYTLETPCPSCPSPTGRIHGIARNNIYLECHTPNYLPVLITWNNDTLFTTDTFIDISGLNHNTLYDFELRTICDGEYSEPLTLSATTLDYCNYPIVYVDTVTSTTATIQMSRLHPNDINELFFEFLQDDEVIATTTELSYTFTDLQPNTQYNLSARAYCNDSTYSDTYSFSFFTTFEVICEDGNSITVSNTDASDATIGFIPGYSMYNYSYSEVIIPAEQLAGIGTVKALQFKPSATAGGGKFSNCEIYLANTTQADLADGFIQDTNTFQLVWSGDMNYTSTDWQSILFDQPFEWDGNSNIVVAVRRNDGTYASGSQFEAYEADAVLGRFAYRDDEAYTIGSITDGTATTTVPLYRLVGCAGEIDTTVVACSPVTDLTVSNVGTNSATLSWNSEADSYIVYDMADNNVLATTTGLTFTLSDLLNNTNYTLGVQAVCGEEVSSVRSVSLHTTCLPTALPYYEGFENGISCWTVYGIVDNTSTGISNEHPFEGDSSFRFWWSTEPPQYLISPELSGTENGVKVKFMYAANEEYPESFVLGYSTTTDDTSAFIWGTEQTNLTNTNHLPYTEVLPAGTKYVAIKYTAYDTWHLYIDNVSFTDPTIVDTVISVINWACDSYTNDLNGETYTESGTYIYEDTTNNIYNIIYLNLKHSATEDITVEAEGEFVWNDQIYTESGIYTDTLTNAEGCDSIVNLYLTITNDTVVPVVYDTIYTDAIACDSYEWNGESYYQSGEYVYVNDSLQQVSILNLTVNYSSVDSMDVVACDSYEWMGQTYNYSDVLYSDSTDANGCTHTTVLMLTINNSSFSIEEATACNAYVWHGVEYTASTDSATYTTTDVNGCDSTITLYLTIDQCSTTEITVCDSYTWHEMVFTESGMYTDGTDTLMLTINNSTSSTTEVTACDSYEWNGETYYQGGEYTFNTTNALGCDSTATLYLSMNFNTNASESLTVCDSYEWNDSAYTVSGTYFREYEAYNGCPSVDTLYLTVNYSSSDTVFVTACDSYVWPVDSNTYTYSDVFYYYNSTAEGCSYTAVLNLTVNNSTSSTTEVTACDSYEWNGETYYQGGEYTFNTTNALGCDSTATLYLSMNFNTNASESLTVCDSYEWNDSAYTVSGTYFREYEAYNGCPSVDTLYLTVNYSSSDTVFVTACDSYVWPVDSNTYTYSDVFYYYNSTAEGCSYTAVLNLTVNNSTSSTTEVTACDSYEWNGEVYTQGGEYSFNTTNALGCDSTAYLYLSMNYNSNSSETFTVCDSLVWYDEVYTATGTYFREYEAYNGCPSVDTLYLTVNYSSSDTVFVTACDSYVWPVDSNTYTYSDVFYYYNSTAEGCSYTAVLNLTVNNSTSSTTEVTACDSYEWNGETYYQGGEYTFNTTNALGCDSTATLYLSMNFNTNASESLTVCDSVVWYDESYYVSGTYLREYEAYNGCPSVDTLYLTVNYNAVDTFYETACDSYLWPLDSNTYSYSDVYYYSNNTDEGCLYTAVLNLTINYSTSSSFDTTACDSYVWNDSLYTEGGVYSFVTTNALGCDSTAYLYLSMNYNSNSSETFTVCDSLVWYDEVYTATGTYFREYEAYNGCPSVDTLYLTVNYSSSDTVFVTACDSYVWPVDSNTYTYSDVFYYYNSTAEGCSYTAVLNLTINYSTATEEDAYNVCDTFVWNNTVYTQAGDYSEVFQALNGCDSTATLHLFLNYSSAFDTAITACDEFFWNDQLYYESGTYTFNTTNLAGCDSTVTLYLTVNHNSSSSETLTVCDSTVWHGETYTYSDDFFFEYEDGNGCASLDTLHLTVNYSTSSSFDTTACDSYVWNDSLYTEGGVYSFVTTNALGCDSTAYLYLSMNYNSNSSETFTVCDSLVWYDEVYTATGTYFREYEAGNGCPSVDTLYLTVNYNAVDTFYETACDSYLWPLDSNTYSYSDVYYYSNNTDEGCLYTAVLNLTINYSTSSSFDTTACDSYVWNDSLYTEGGVYSFVTTNALGCDSTAYLYLSMNYNSNSSETFTVCDSLVWYDEVYTATGTYFREYEAGNGCPSVDTLFLTVNYSSSDTVVVTTCGSYEWNGSIYNATGEYTSTVANALGCDSTTVLNLTILENEPIYTTVTESACNSFTWNGTTYYESGEYNLTATAANGCDSIVTLMLTINEDELETILVTTCGSYEWNGTTYNVSGEYSYNTVASTGCDSTAILQLTVNTPVTVTLSETACDIYEWNGETYTQSGVYTYTTTNVAGCDSTVTLYLTIGNAVTSSMDVSVCDSYTWNGTTYTTSGVYTFTTEGSNGCDSIAELNLTVGESATTFLNVTSCDSYVWNGQIFTTSTNNATWQTTNANGCDSIVILNLTINYSTVSTEDITACNSFVWHGETYTASNNSATYMTTNAAGCDSTVTLNLTINYSTVDTMYVTACDSYEWWGNQTFSTSGQYSYDTTNVNSCESTTILDLTINQSTSNVETITACNSYTWHGATYTTSNNNATYTTSNAVGCDSTVTLNLTVNRSSSSTIVQTVCDNYEWNDTVINNSGVYNFISTNAVGCDSSIILNLTVNRRSASTETDTACDSYTWHSETYTVSGQYNYTTTNAAGCDSTVTLNLTIGNSTNNAETVVACNAYKWNNVLYNESGVYSFSTVNETGCESISTLYLTINSSSASTETVTACDSYEWNGEVYTTSGDHTFTSTNAAGCDSTVTLNLTINNSSVSTETETACDSYTWHGTTYTSTTSTPTYTTTNAVGCDSTVTLNLTLNHSTTGIETVTACDSYTWHGSTYTSSTSTPTYTIFNAAGCDSTVTLNLTVNHSTTGTETITACNSYVWHGVEYFASTDNATFTTTNAAGCDSTITLHLTINQCSSTQIIACDSYTWHGNTYTASGMYVIDGDTLLLTINRSSSFAEIASACDSYAWNDSVYTNSGRYNYRTTNAIGCDSTVTLNLTIRYSTVSTEVITACDSYNWHGINIPTSISGLTYTTTNAAGCDSTVTLNLTINRSSTGIETVTACDNYTWYGQTYTASNGNATHTLVGSNIYGCDSTVTLHLTVNYSSQGDTVASACTFFDWYEHSNLTASQNVNHTFVGSNLSGCDSTVTLHLTINNCSTTIDTACGVYSWHGNTYTSSGIYNVGYDTLILTVFRNSFADTFAVACGSFDWYEYSDLTGSQSISRTLIAANGCDSTVTLHLTVNQCSTTEVTACGSYNWRGINFVSSGTYIIGTDTLILTIHRNTTGDTIARVCGGLDWYEYENLTSSQNVSHTFVGGNANGCDSTVTLHLIVKQCSVSTVVACDSYEWHGYTLTSSGTYTEGNDTLILTINRSTSGDTLALSYGNFDWYEYTNLNSTQSVSHTFPNANAAGCDSTVTLHLLVAQIASKTSGVDTVVACDSYVWHGFTLTSSGMYPLGTDTLLLTIRRSNTSDTLASACGSFDWYEHTDLSVTQNIAHTFTGANVNGCDSTVTLHLTINQCSVSNVTACDSYTWHGLTFTSSGSYHDGLDTLNLTINHSTTGDTTATACSSFDWYEYTDMNTSQNVDRTFFAGSANGCDSTVTLHLTINHCSTTVVNACDSYDWHGFTITSSGTYHVGFDTLLLTVNHSSTEDTAATACGSFTWYEHSDLTASQDVAHTFVAGNAYGCDKTVTLHLTINNCSTTRVAACGSYTWLGNTYASSGVYNVGHDTLILTINRNTTADTIATACDSFDWYEHTNLTSSQNVIHTFVGGNANGCDSTVTLHLTVNHCSNAAIEVCDSYTWHGNVYYNSGLYIDGTDTLQLVVNHSTASIESALACDSYTWHGITYTSTTSIPTYTTTNAVGCDSTVTLNLTVNYSTETTVTETATGSYTWNGNTYSESGTYYWYSTTVDGCDSTVTLILTVTTGIDDVNSEITLNVYPNPTTSWITIDADDILKVEVYDLYGRKLATHQNTDRINLQGLASGTYTLRVQTLHGTAIQRVLLK